MEEAAFEADQSSKKEGSIIDLTGHDDDDFVAKKRKVKSVEVSFNLDDSDAEEDEEFIPLPKPKQKRRLSKNRLKDKKITNDIRHFYKTK